jgi:DNA-binding transcriptional regulator GbsR (MarR family)
MSLEERVAALEKGLAAIQQDFLLYRTDTTSSSTLGILNKVIATQELRYREISENETMLVGMFASMQRDVKTLQEDVSDIKDRLGRLETKFDEHTGLLIQILERLQKS